MSILNPTARELAEQVAEGADYPTLGDKYQMHPEAIRGRVRRWRDKHPGDWAELEQPNRPVVEGIFPDDDAQDADALWEFVIDRQRRYIARNQRRRAQTITIDDARPVGVAFFADLHLGNPGVDYEQARRDAEIVAETDGLYAGFHGDGIDNWIVGRLQAQQRGQAVGFDGEKALFRSWIDMLGDDLLWFIPGNHELWSLKEAGIDEFRNYLRGTRVLYDRHQILVTLRLADADWRVLVRHKWKYGSVFNDTHGLEVAWERIGIDFDIAVGGHDHRGTLARPFYRHGRKRYAVKVGTYKLDGDYGRELGLEEPNGRGCGAMLFFPDGRLHWSEDLETAASFLRWLRK